MLVFTAAATFMLSVALLGQPLARVAVFVSALAFGAGLLALPAAVPLGLWSVPFTDVLVPLAAYLCVMAFGFPFSPTRLLVFVAVLVTGMINGILGEAPKLLTEARGPVYFVCAVVVAGCIYRSENRQSASSLIGAGLAFSAALVLASALSGRDFVGGRVAALASTSNLGALDVTRYLVPTAWVAATVLGGGVSLALTGALPINRRTAICSISCAILVLLSFSRNHLVMIGGSAVITVLVRFRPARVVRTVVGLVLFSAAAVVVSKIVGGGFVVAQLNSYVDRVVGGLGAAARNTDSSVLLRLQENYFARQAWSHSPLFGQGIGTVYRPPIGTPGSEPFWLSDGRYYIHNNYWRFLVKMGVLGLASFLWLAIGPLRGAIRRGGSLGIASAATLLGALAAAFTVPTPWEGPSALVLGSLIGIVSALEAPSWATSLSPAAVRGTR